MRLIRIPSWRTIVASLPLLALIGLFVMLPVGYGMVSYTTRPEFCRTCHNMEPYVASWEQSSHRSVPCVDCHYEPGLLETAEGKFKALSQLAKYVTGTEGTKPWAEVSDASCMRAGCHTTRLLAGNVQYDVGGVSIAFDHAPHLLEMRRSKRLRCTSCHSQIVQGEHVSVTPSTCFLCHFKGDDEDPHLSDCSTCHGPPKRAIQLEGFTFQHDDYVGRGVECRSCHSAITRGTGEVPKRRCGSCHAVVEHIERYGETEFLHRQHVTDHKVDCLECHTEVTHRLGKREALESGGSCARCHQATHGVAEAFLQGMGSRTVPETPSAMWLARVSCTGCHLHIPRFDRDAQGATTAREVACLSCHGPQFQGMMGRWQARYEATTEAVGADVAAALEAARVAPNGGELLPALVDADHDIGLVRADGSRGVHNPWFARALLRSAADRATEAWRRLDASRPPAPFVLDPPFATELPCAGLCHMGIEEREIGLAGTRFQHARHLGEAGDCNRCHSVETHGETLIGKDDCAGCHHGPERPQDASCATCHGETDRFLRGIEPGFEEPVQMMAKVGCFECHGDPPATDARAAAQENCLRCHGDKYEDTLEEWLDYTAEWLDEADAALAPLSARARAREGVAPDALTAAEELLARLKRVRPAHNLLLFEELTGRFEELTDEAKDALK